MAPAPTAPAPAPAAEPVVESTVEPRRSGRIRNQVVRFEDEVLLLDNDEPTTYKEAMMGSDSGKWQVAMKSEIESMYENQVWNLVDPPDGVRPSNVNGSIRRRHTLTVILLSIKLDLSQRGFDKFKELTTTRLSLP